jgi:hypothetical protein
MRMVKIEQDAMAHAPRDVPSTKHERYQQLIHAAQKHGPITVAVVHPCDGASMSGALAASRLRLIKPILVGPVERCGVPLNTPDCKSTGLSWSEQLTVMIRPPKRSR